MNTLENSVLFNNTGLMVVVVIFLFASLIFLMGKEVYNAVREFRAERDGYELPEDDELDTVLKFMIQLCFLIIITVILLVIFILPVFDMVNFV